MKIYLLDYKYPDRRVINKDLAGGFGTASYFGDSFLARLLIFGKKMSVCLPSTTLGYVASILQTQGHNVYYVEQLKEIDQKADVVFILSSVVTFSHDIKAIVLLKKRLGNNTKIGVLGAFPSARPQEFLNSADFVVQGEPEGFLQRSLEKEKLQGVIVSPIVSNLDNLPFPDWTLFPTHRYSYAPSIRVKPFLPIISSRGCVFSCSHYCPYTVITGRKWRARSMDNVIEEIKYLQKRFGVQGLLFRDAVFSLDQKRIVDFCQKIINQKVKIQFACETRLDLLNEELIDLLKASGLKTVNVGIESSNATILKNSSRQPIANSHQEKIIRYLHRKNIQVAAFYILGLKGDTPETIRQTIKYAQRLNTQIAQFTISTPFPGTPFFEEKQKEIFSVLWDNFDSYTPVCLFDNLSSEEMQRLKNEAYVKYYFRLKWLIKFIKSQFQY